MYRKYANKTNKINGLMLSHVSEKILIRSSIYLKNITVLAGPTVL